MFVKYCLSDDQRHLLASLSDDRGEMVRTTVININIPNRTRRKKVTIQSREVAEHHVYSSLQASARRVGLKRLFDWVLSVMSLSLVPWRLVIGRLGRIGHGELRGWSTLLSRKSLKKAIKQLKVKYNQYCQDLNWTMKFESRILLLLKSICLQDDFALQDQCTWKTDLPSILSVCLISLEPDSVLRLMHDQFTPGK